VVCGTPAAVTAAVAATRGGTVVNTAYIERLNATYRQHLVPLVRRGRALARTEVALTTGMYLVGCAYNFCWVHASLRQRAGPGATTKWIERTPAMAAGLTDRRWTMGALLHYHVPLPAWAPPKRRGRPPAHFVIRAVLPPPPHCAPALASAAGSRLHGVVPRNPLLTIAKKCPRFCKTNSPLAGTADCT
jgi:hypothetical protein